MKIENTPTHFNQFPSFPFNSIIHGTGENWSKFVVFSDHTRWNRIHHENKTFRNPFQSFDTLDSTHKQKKEKKRKKAETIDEVILTVTKMPSPGRDHWRRGGAIWRPAAVHQFDGCFDIDRKPMRIEAGRKSGESVSNLPNK